MQEILTKIKKGMNFSVVQNCGGAVICHDASGLVSGIYPLCAEQSGGVYRRNCPYLLIWTGFIGAAYAFSTRQHMALVLVRDKLLSRDVKKC